MKLIIIAIWSQLSRKHSMFVEWWRTQIKFVTINLWLCDFSLAVISSMGANMEKADS